MREYLTSEPKWRRREARRHARSWHPTRCERRHSRHRMSFGCIRICDCINNILCLFLSNLCNLMEYSTSVSRQSTTYIPDFSITPSFLGCPPPSSSWLFKESWSRGHLQLLGMAKQPCRRSIVWTAAQHSRSRMMVMHTAVRYKRERKIKRTYVGNNPPRSLYGSFHYYEPSSR